MTLTQRVVAAFFIGVWTLLIGLRIVAEDTIRVALGLAEPAISLFIVGITALIGVLLLGIVRRWRWVFWIVLVASLGGALRIVGSALELAGLIATALPAWYVLLQGAIGAVQVGVAAVMIQRYRRGGIWT